MNLDLSIFYREYEALVSQVDAVFNRVAVGFESEVKCAKGCSDCCHAVFDVSLVEAMYLNDKFLQISDPQHQEILIAADKADRKAQILKRNVSREAVANQNSEVLNRIARERLRCPLLDVEDRCVLYDYRPITCRLYGIPLEIGGRSHTCGFSGFEPGKEYPAVKIERIQDSLVSLSSRLLDHLQSRYHDFRLMHVPVSTALITVYSEEYFGVPPQNRAESSIVDESGSNYA